MFRSKANIRGRGLIINIAFIIEPQLHITCTGVACFLGYLAHRYEETSEERVQRLLEKHPHAPVQWASMVRDNGESI